MAVFERLKIIDLSTVLAGPSVGTFFAELGASVVKIEHPKFGDVTRSWKLPSEDIQSSVSAYFSSVNYKKSYLKLDLRDPEDLSLCLKHISESHILLTNFKLGDEEKFGLTDEVLRQTNPTLIRGKISGFGDDSDRVAYDLILQAESGFMSMNGTADSGPVKMPVALIDVLAAHHLKEGLLCALLENQQSPEFRSVSVSLYDAAVVSLVNQATNYLMEGHVPVRIGSLHPNIAPYGEIFTTRDNKLITFAIGSDHHFEKVCELLICSELTQDVRFVNNKSRVENRRYLAGIWLEKIKNLSAFEILDYCRKNHVPAGQIKSLDEVFEEKKAQELVRKETIDGTSTQRMTSIAWKNG